MKKEGKKKQPSAYNLFVKKFIADHKAEKKGMKEAGAEWKKLSESEKAKYKK